MRFTKMQGLGNDYLFLDSPTEPANPAALSVRLSDRHFGVGSDGMIWILPSDCADFKMRIFNADGSEAEMCGNGIRCLGKYVYEKGLTDRTTLTVETLAGIRTLKLDINDGKVTAVTVSMGIPAVSEPMKLPIGERVICLRPVSMGNPHAVLFVPDAEAAPLTSLGPVIEKHPTFPEGVNVEFVQVLDRHTLRMRVWERGSGVTLACGTGACAAASAAMAEGFCSPEEELTVRPDGGELRLRFDSDGCVWMTGSCETVFEGEIPDEIL